MSRERLLERFLRYVQVETTADPESNTTPTTPGQLALGAMIADELRQLGLTDVVQSNNGPVYATVPAAGEAVEGGIHPGDVPALAFNSHLDTSPEASGRNVRPRVIEDYDGQDVPLERGPIEGGPPAVLRVADNPVLSALVGKTLIVTDGTTLLGGDDKAGVAVIVEAAARLIESGRSPRGPIRVLLTCDEEIGRAVASVDLERLDASAAFTLDGEGAGQIDVETFSADVARITFHGVNIHPSIAYGRMANAVRAVGTFLTKLPPTMAPETTQGRDGFLHPYRLHESGVDRVTLDVLLRDFAESGLRSQETLLRSIAAEVEALHPGIDIVVDVTKQYRNLAEGLAKRPEVLACAEAAAERLGRPLRRGAIRGGTDGSQLTERGLPTPNLATGQHNPHSVLEFACLDEMEQAVELIQEIVTVWAERHGCRG